jgi:transposase InsO family protein
LPRLEGWQVNNKRVERLWRREGLKVPKKQHKRGKLWLNEGSCVRLRPEHGNNVWSYDFVMARTSNGRPLRMLNIIDEYTRECLCIKVARKITAQNVLEEELLDLIVKQGPPDHIRPDNGLSSQQKQSGNGWAELA